MRAPGSRRHGEASFGSCTDVGCIREHNEDSLAVVPPLYLVCDGMGGHAAGEVASEIAAEVISRRAPSAPDATALGQAVEEANLAILRAARDGYGREGMGTTCTAAMLENERLVIAQVGDSRAYLLHHGRLSQLTRDHSLVADMVEAGEITAAEARYHEKRSVITRALGSDPRTQPDLYEFNVETGDRLLLCSDGLTAMLEDDRIASILGGERNPQDAAVQLTHAAVSAGGFDNVTVVVVDVAGFAEQRSRRLSRRAKVTAALILAALVAVLAGAAFAVNYWTGHSAYLGEQDGMVAVYRGVPGEVLGMGFSTLEEVTDVPLDRLQAGLAERVRSGRVRTDSVDAAFELVEGYRRGLAEAAAAEDAAAEAGDSAAAAGETPSGSGSAGERASS